MAGTSSPLQEILAQLSRVVLTEAELRRDLERVLGVAQTTVPGCDAGSVTLVVEGEPRTEAAFSRVVLSIDLAQYALREGPCLLAMAENRPIRVDLLLVDERFPQFRERADLRGVLSSLSLPVVVDGEVVGSLNLYSSQSRAFDDTAQDLGALLAAQVGLAVAKSRVWPQARQAAATVQAAADDTNDIAVAEGILMAVEECSAEQAEALLRNAATSEAATLAEIARRVIAQLR